MKIAVLLANALVQLAAAAFVGFMLLMGLNGYHERDAQPGLILYIIVSLLSALGVGAAGFWATAKIAEKTSLGSVAAGAISFIIFAAVGCVVLIVGAFAAVILIEALRNK